MAGVLALALGWSLLALRSPTTTYHVAPAVVTVTPIWIIRRRSVPRVNHAIRYVVLGAAIAAITTVTLSASGNLQGPTLTGSHAATTEAILAIAVGVALALTGALFRHRSH